MCSCVSIPPNQASYINKFISTCSDGTSVPVQIEPQSSAGLPRVVQDGDCQGLG
ncbi:hypothetical protein Hanom_Chr12g01075791 [Helianthus anomalus]